MSVDGLRRCPFQMYPVAHIVVASGAAWSAERAVRRLFRSRAAAEGAQAAAAGSLFDYRLVAAGSWLPDAIDRPLAWLIIADHVEDDHLLAHTLVFGLVLAVPALYLAWRGQSGLISLTAGDRDGVLQFDACSQQAGA